jgi:Carboxypeptidase regulatory-like domain
MPTSRLPALVLLLAFPAVAAAEPSIHGLIPQALGETWFSTLGTRSGTDGTFEVRLGAGQYKVRVQKPGFAPFETTVGVPPGGEVPVEIPLKVGAEP